MRKIQIRKPRYNPKSDFGMNGRKDIIITIQKMLRALAKPEKAVEDSPEIKQTLTHSFLMLAAIELLLILITGFRVFDLTTVIMFGLLGALLYAVIVPTGVLVISAMLWMFSALMGAKQNFESQTNSFILFLTPIFIIASVISVILMNFANVGMVINLILILYALYGVELIVKKITELPTWKVVVSIILSIIISFILILVTQTMGVSTN